MRLPPGVRTIVESTSRAARSPDSTVVPATRPAIVRPPTLSWASITITEALAASSSLAAVSPASPAPTTTASTAVSPGTGLFFMSSVTTKTFGQGLAGRRLPGLFGVVVRLHQATLNVPGAQPAQRFRLPGARLVVDGWQAGHGGVPADDQVRKRLTREVRGRNALPRVAAGCRDTLGRVVGHRRHPIAGHRERSPPGVGEPRAFEGREPLPRRAAQHLVRGLVEVVVVPYARAVVVGRAAAAEEYAPVGRAGEVVHGVAVGGHALAALPADLCPLRLGEGFGQDDQGVDGQHLPAQLGQPRQVGLPREHDGAGAYLANVRHQPRACAGLEVGYSCPLEDLTAEALDGPGEPAREPRGVNGRAVRIVERPPGAGDPDAFGALLRVEQHEVFLDA